MISRWRMVLGAAASLVVGFACAGEVRGQGLPSISIQDATLAEGNGGTNQMVFTVMLSRRPSQPVSVLIQTSDQTATGAGQCGGNADYGNSGLQSLSFTGGDSVKTFFVTTCGDVRDEENETFRVFLSSPSNATIGDGEAVGTLLDDDGPPSLSIAGASIAEGNDKPTDMAFTVTLSAISGREVRVAYTTGTTTPSPATLGANCGGDVDVQSTAGTLVIPPGQPSGTVNVRVCGDATLEGNERFRVTLSSPVNATLQTAVATGTILNDDAPGVRIADRTLAEGNPTIPGGIATTSTSQNLSSPSPLTFTVTLSHPTVLPVTLTWETRNGTATGGAQCREQAVSGNFQLPGNAPTSMYRFRDFVAAAAQTLTIPAGSLTGTITVSTCRDFKDEANEAFEIVIVNAVNATLVDGSGACTLNNDD